jgi:hypothetical protein
VDGVPQATQISEGEIIVSMRRTQLHVISEHRMHFRATYEGKIKAVPMLDKLSSTA